MDVIKLSKINAQGTTVGVIKSAMPISPQRYVCVNSHMKEAHIVEKYSYGATYPSPLIPKG